MRAGLKKKNVQSIFRTACSIFGYEPIFSKDGLIPNKFGCTRNLGDSSFLLS